LAGLAHPNFKHGRFSKHLPAQTAARAEEARTNPRLLSLSDNIAVLEARLAELFAALERGESPSLWETLRTTWTRLHQAFAAGDGVGMQAAERDMERLLAVGGNQAAAWTEIGDVMLKQARLVQTEVKTLQSLQQMITVQQNQLMLGAVMNVLVEAVREYTDVPSGRKILMAVQQEMTRLSTQEGR